MKKNLCLIAVGIIFLGALTFTSCEKQELQPVSITVSEPGDDNGEFMEWLDKNAVIKDKDYEDENGVKGILYQLKNSDQLLFLPVEGGSTKGWEALYYQMSLDYDLSDGFYVTCSGTGICCGVYNEVGGGVTIRLNPVCYRAR